MRTAVAAFASLACCVTALAAVPSKRLFIPAAGRVQTATGAAYTTDLWITNAEDERATVKIAFLESGKGEPRFRTIEIPARSTTELYDVAGSLLGRPGVIGGLFIESDRHVTATARLGLNAPGVASGSTGGTITAVPIEMAAGAGETVVLAGSGAAGGSSRYNIHLAETNRSGVRVRIVQKNGEGATTGEKDVLLGPLEAKSVAADFSTPRPDDGWLELKVVSGSGRIVAAGSRIDTTTLDPVQFEMTFPRRTKSSIPPIEIVIWVTAGAAVALSAIASLRRGIGA